MRAPVTIVPEEDPKSRRRILEALTAHLPEWFGRDDSNLHYARQADLLEGWVARIEARCVALLLLKRHSSSSAEIYWLGVDPDHHRQGIGAALLGAAEDRLRHEKVRFLFVMTLHPDDPYEPYRRTRLFYERMGFELALSCGRTVAGPSADLLAYYLKLLGTGSTASAP